MSLTSLEMSRLRWQCRRGLLENDLILERFLDRHVNSLSSEGLETFKSLLSMDDNELWDILSGRVECLPDANPVVREIVTLLRTC